jgi:hypothetical protein
MPKLTENVFVQSPGESLLGILNARNREVSTPPASGKYKLVHIINTYRTPPESLEAKVHQATFTSMQTARTFTGDKHEVNFTSVQFPEDRDIVPAVFHTAGNLDRSVLDIATFRVPRKLPLLFDILKLGVATAGNTGYVVFTNADINLMPQFYDCIGRIIDYGFDVIVVNRREIPHYSADTDMLALMYSDYGVIHEGFDCFVFPVEMFSQFISNHACVGAGLVMRGLLYNLAAHANNMLVLRDCHLTFHLGQDRAWQAPELKDYTEYNRANASEIIDKLSTHPDKGRRLKFFLTGGR